MPGTVLETFRDGGAGAGNGGQRIGSSRSAEEKTIIGQRQVIEGVPRRVTLSRALKKTGTFQSKKKGEKKGIPEKGIT